jgi:hypothetical protein
VVRFGDPVPAVKLPNTAAVFASISEGSDQSSHKIMA